MENADKNLTRLIKLGLTTTQARIYLTLSKTGKATADTISRSSGITRPDTYRVLNKLQEAGLITTEIANPRQFQATPIPQATSILLNQKLEEYKQAVEEAEELMQNLRDTTEQAHDQRHKILVINGKRNLVQLIQKEHNKVQHCAYIISPLQRWLQIAEECYENYERALERGVNYRIVLEQTEGNITIPENIQTLLAKPTFQLKLSSTPLDVNAAVFDDKTAIFNSSPTMPIGKSPIIWTNHPSFLRMCNDHFEKLWKTAKRITATKTKKIE